MLRWRFLLSAESENIHNFKVVIMIRVIEVPEVPLQVQLAELTRNLDALVELKAGLSDHLAGLCRLLSGTSGSLTSEVDSQLAYAQTCASLMGDREEALFQALNEVKSMTKKCNQALVNEPVIGEPCS